MCQKKSLVRLKESLKEEGFSSIGGMTMCFPELHVFTESVTVMFHLYMLTLEVGWPHLDMP